jgi:hypothetical protein
MARPSRVDVVKLANYPPRCGAGSSGRGRNPDDMSLAALPSAPSHCWKGAALNPYPRPKV